MAVPVIVAGSYPVDAAGLLPDELGALLALVEAAGLLPPVLGTGLLPLEQAVTSRAPTSMAATRRRIASPPHIIGRIGCGLT
jgi:hypothetical protein